MRRRRGLAVLAAALALAFAVAWAHSGLAMDHMGPPTAMCLAIVDGGLVLGAALIVATGAQAAPPVREVLRPHALAAGHTVARSVPARAGPAVLQVFRL